MNSLKVLDVTLRDGGCVNNFNFGTEYMQKILQAQEKAGIDIIELGYLDDKRGSETGRTQFISEKAVRQNFLRQKNADTKYVVMMDYGKYDVDNLEQELRTELTELDWHFIKRMQRKQLKVQRYLQRVTKYLFNQ